MKIGKFHIALLLCWWVFLPTHAQLFDDVCIKANSLKNEGQYLEALHLLKEHSEEAYGRHLLDILFMQGECCYMLDDYNQLEKCSEQYDLLYEDYLGSFGENSDLYEAYKYKLTGACKYHEIGHTAYAINDAFENYLKCLEIFKNRHADEQVNVMYQELAQMCYKGKLYEEAILCLQDVLNYYQKRVDLGILSDEPAMMRTISQLAMCEARMALFTKALEHIDEALEWQHTHQHADYLETLRRKGKILMMQGDAMNIDNRKIACEYYEKYVSGMQAAVSGQLADMTESQRDQYWMAAYQFLADAFRLGNTDPEMLYNATLFSKGYLLNYKHHPKGRPETWKDVQKVLKADECAIEFVLYDDRNDERRLGCLVLRKNFQSPQFIDILSTDSFMHHRMESRLLLEDHLVSKYGEYKNELYTDDYVSHAIWTAQLMKAIGTAKNVYFAPDGFLHQLAIEYIMPDTTKTCYRLSSTRMLVAKRNPQPSTLNLQPSTFDSMLLFGGIDYFSETSPKTRDNDKEAYRFMRNMEVSWPNLFGSGQEVDSIYTLRKNPKDKLFTGGDATDETFRQWVGGGYPVVHLSTHGFFMDNMEPGTDLKPRMYDDAMSKNILVFAGASNTIQDIFFDDSQADGILSARELSRMNMKDVKLMVLSACQTGLGYITADGVYGLQRGLKQAGVQSMIVSLWPVNDYATMTLMHYFYANLKEQKVKKPHAAFLQARKRLMTEMTTVHAFDSRTLHVVEVTYSFDDPEYVNPFIMIDVFE